MSDVAALVHHRCPGTSHVICGLTINPGAREVPTEEDTDVDDCIVCQDLVTCGQHPEPH